MQAPQSVPARHLFWTSRTLQEPFSIKFLMVESVTPWHKQTYIGIVPPSNNPIGAYTNELENNYQIHFQKFCI